MGAVLVALLLQQAPDLFGDDPFDSGPAPNSPDSPPQPRPRQDDGPLVIPPPDGPVPDGVPKGEHAAPLKPPPIARGRDEWRIQLAAERQKLLDDMPKYGVPVAVTAIGGVAFLFGGAFALLGLPAALRGKFEPTFSIGAPMGVIGLGALVFGLIWVRERWLDRDPFWERIHEIETELGW